jgi:translation elongation factor EF-Tu-like GTPase
MLQHPFRMTVKDVFDIQGRPGPILLGTIDSGRIAIGDSVIAEGAPESLSGRVIAIEKFQRLGLREASAAPDDVGLEIAGMTASQARAIRVLRRVPPG